MEWYENADWVTVRITKKTKLGFPTQNLQFKFEEKHCAAIIAGSVFWEGNLAGRIIPEKSKGQVSTNKRWLELKLKKADQVVWKKLVVSSSGGKKHGIGKLGLLPKFISQKIIPGLLGKRPTYIDVLRKDFKKDFKEDFISTCSASLTRLERLKSGNSELREIRKQLEEKKVLISIFGFHNSGKSTLLNAILGDELLPMNAQNETSLNVNLKHDPDKHRGVCPSTPEKDPVCEKCPQLWYMRGGTEMGCIGASKILLSLQDANTRARKEAGRETKEAIAVDTPPPPLPEYLVVANIPILSNVPDPWRAYLVDNPGFDDPIAGITNVAEVAMKTTSAYMYVLDYGILQGQSDTKHFNLLYEKDPGIFSSDFCRLVIVVTKFDNFYTESEAYSQISEEKIKENVCASIESATGSTTFPKENIVPVSGKMALFARRHRRMELPTRTQRWINRFLEDYIDLAPRGEGQVSKVPTDHLEQADMLEKASGFLVLEERMKEMMSHCVELWVKNIATNCCWYIATTVEDVETSTDQIEQHLKELQEKYTNLGKWHKKMLEEEKKLEKTTDSSSDTVVFKEIHEACKKDAEEPTKDITVMTNALVDKFLEDCKLKMKKRKYTTEDFERDMDIFLADASQQLGDKLEKLLVFNEVHDVRTKQEKRVGIAEGNIRKYAESFCSEEQHTPQYQEPESQLETSQMSASISDVVKGAAPNLQALQKDVTIPPPELSLWTRFKRRIKEFFRGDPETIKQGLKSEDLNDPTDDLRKAVTEGIKKYIHDEILRAVAQHYYRAYCHSVSTSLMSITQEFEGRIKAKQAEQKKRKDDIDDFEQEIIIQREWCTHMIKLAEYLNKKADEFKTSAVQLK